MSAPTVSAAPADAMTRRRWSFSAASAADRCPTMWDFRYGDGRDHREGDADAVTDVARRRGKVVHAGMCVALRHAQTELDTRSTPLTGAHLYRYWRPARIELGAAFVRERMPTDPHEGQMCVDLLEATLRDVEVPRPGAIHGIETEYDVVSPRGVWLRFVPDWTWWSAPGVLRVVDWKSGKIDPTMVARHPQLLTYAELLRLSVPGVEHIEIELYSMREGRGYVEPADPVLSAKALARVERTALARERATEHPAVLGPHCGGCVYRNICPAIAERNAAAVA